MRLPIVEFIRRFMLHLMPARFVRIRHCGLLDNRMRRTLLPLCLQLLGVAPQPGEQEHHRWDQRALLVAVSGIGPNRCPQCTKEFNSPEHEAAEAMAKEMESVVRYRFGINATIYPSFTRTLGAPKEKRIVVCLHEDSVSSPLDTLAVEHEILPIDDSLPTSSF